MTRVQTVTGWGQYPKHIQIFSGASSKSDPMNRGLINLFLFFKAYSHFWA